jgi:septal ring factor EnvC (AmiA/AmiB activator)
MDQPSSAPAASRPLLPWLALALVVILAAGTTFWLNQKIDSLQVAAAAPRQQTDANETRQAVAGLQQTIADIQSGQQKLGEQVSQMQHTIAADAGERKLLSDQLGALSSRVDALASASAEARSQKTNRGKR